MNMSDSELLPALSDMMDKKLDAKLQPIKDNIRSIKIDIENTIKPQIQLLAENYIPAARRFEEAATKVDLMQADIELLKKVVTEHSEKLQKIS